MLRQLTCTIASSRLFAGSAKTDRTSNLLIAALLLAVPHLGQAQQPADNELQRAQQKAGTAYRDVRQAEFEAQQAELDFKQSETDYKAAQKRADDSKRELDASSKKLDAAKAKLADARKRYDAAVNAVDKIPSPAPVQK